MFKCHVSRFHGLKPRSPSKISCPIQNSSESRWKQYDSCRIVSRAHSRHAGLGRTNPRKEYCQEQFLSGCQCDCVPFENQQGDALLLILPRYSYSDFGTDIDVRNFDNNHLSCSNLHNNSDDFHRVSISLRVCWVMCFLQLPYQLFLVPRESREIFQSCGIDQSLDEIIVNYIRTLTSTGTLSLTTTTISTNQIYTTNVLVITATVSTTIVDTLRKREPETAATEVNRRGNLPSWIAVFASSKISTACNCLSIPTPTVTSTTVTSTSKTIFSTSPTVTLDIDTLGEFQAGVQRSKAKFKNT